jgi:DNA-binding NarL/FixJ family response regulator
VNDHIKILVVDDHNLVRTGIISMLQSQPGMLVVGDAVSGRQALEKLESGIEADIILSDITMSDLTGFELLKRLKQGPLSHIKVLFLSMISNENSIIEAFSYGASGYLLKNAGHDELMFAIRHIAADNKYISSELTWDLLSKLSRASEHPDHDLSEILSKREIEILNLIADGHTNTEIADILFTSRRTVEGHRQNMMVKTGLKNTAALVRYAVTKGIVN